MTLIAGKRKKYDNRYCLFKKVSALGLLAPNYEPQLSSTAKNSITLVHDLDINLVTRTDYEFDLGN